MSQALKQDWIYAAPLQHGEQLCPHLGTGAAHGTISMTVLSGSKPSGVTFGKTDCHFPPCLPFTSGDSSCVCEAGLLIKKKKLRGGLQKKDGIRAVTGEKSTQKSLLFQQENQKARLCVELAHKIALWSSEWPSRGIAQWSKLLSPLLFYFKIPSMPPEKVGSEFCC